MQEWTIAENIAEVDIAGVDSDGVIESEFSCNNIATIM